MNKLFIIPARGGSKGIPKKNIKYLAGKPLIYYTIEAAKYVMTPDDDLCISTDSDEIKNVVESIGVEVPFSRPAELGTDTAGTYEVLLHALSFYEELKKKKYDQIILLQPTSPFRRAEHIKEALKLYHPKLDMVVSVKISDANPYFILAEENVEGYLEKSKKGTFKRRQDCPVVYQYNGAIFIINPESLKEKHLSEFKLVKKFIMDEISSVDLDTPLDWAFAEFLTIKNVKL